MKTSAKYVTFHFVLKLALLPLLLYAVSGHAAPPVTKVAEGGAHSLFVKSDGSLWVMGYNSYGELGDGTIHATNRPEEIVSSGVTAVAGGIYYTLFVETGGSLWAMGDNSHGQLGDGTTDSGNLYTNRPEEIVPGGVVAVSGNQLHSLFVKSDGSLWAMGANLTGALGDGTMNSTNQPEEIVPAGVTAVAAGLLHSLFLKSDGSLWGMGYNGDGELGDGTLVNTNRPEQIVGPPPALPALGVGIYSNQPVVYFPVIPSPNYVVQMATNLASPNWVTVTNTVPFVGVQITNAPPTAFFRLF